MNLNLAHARRISLLCGVMLAGAGLVSAGTGNLVAVDALGRTVGPIVDFDPLTGTMQVELRLNRETVRFAIVNQVFTHFSRPLVYYEADDCTGQPYLAVAESMTVPGAPAAIAGAGQTLYRGDPQTSAVRSVKSAMWTTTCKSVDLELGMMRGTPLLDLGFEFMPPYRAVTAGGRATGRKPSPQGSGNAGGGLQDVERR